MRAIFAVKNTLDKEINKNGIHSFEEQTIGAWYDITILCQILVLFVGRDFESPTLDIPDYN